MSNKFRTVWFVLCTGIHILGCNGEENITEDHETNAVPVLGPPDLLEKQSKHLKYSDFDMEDAIQKIETLSKITEQIDKVNDLLPETDVENFYDHMIQAVDRVQYAIHKPDNLYNFMNANGALRILSTNLRNTNSALRTKLLLLLKDIFDLAPTAADNLLPINIIDRLVDIFDNDNNLAVKTHALDILYTWLPKNPQAQVRVMKISGLETFYKQIEKLDISVIKTLMELFNMIIKEHLDVRNGREQIAKDDETMKLYQSIGVFEHISNLKVCDGLLNVFQLMWSFNKNENDNLRLVLDLVINVKPFCSKFYKKSKAIELFESLLKSIDDEEKKEYLEKLDLNVTDVRALLEEYVRKEKRIADEF